MCLVILSKSSSLGLLLECCGHRAPLVPAASVVPAAFQEGISFHEWSMLLGVSHPSGLFTITGHSTMSTARKSHTALPEKCEPHAPHTECTIPRLMSKTATVMHAFKRVSGHRRGDEWHSMLVKTAAE